MICDEVESRAQGGHILDQVLADHAHDFPDRFARLVFALAGEAAQEGDVDWGVELAERLAIDSEPVGGIVRSAAVEPFSHFKPCAKLACVLVDAQVLEYGERAQVGT